MIGITWNEQEHTVGNLILDNQHQAVLGLINKLSDQYAHPMDLKGGEVNGFDVTFGQLQENIRDHFTYEERLLERVGFGEGAHHKEGHLKFMQKMNDLSFADEQARFELVSFLMNWWDNHILVEDMKCKHYFEQSSQIELINWDDDQYSVGNRVIDKQHKVIVQMLNKLITEADLNVHSETVHDTLADMLRYAKDHLDYEEALLKKINYADLNDHALLHWEYLESVSALSMKAADGNKAVPKELIAYLTHWWNDHILIEDMQYKPFMK